ncbi:MULTISPECIES: DUF3299 domain-containing protein [Ferrimonas]|uniref:DUF3299 domain-containing protein n=1 Tax=Ferrimonas TaxID=44011 RepID=UPI0004043817|nr:MULTISPECIES: DUF3299 domain-containing protein [Ferrimonas]USD38988.1 DUF3299 domain-containing protein [Ferrimonas sp. SCSIO 43195]
MKARYLAVAFLALLSQLAQAEPRVLEWDALIPQEERDNPPPPPSAAIHPMFADESAPIDWVQTYGKVVSELNGKEVRLAGFVVPLEGDGELVTEFLLVPYYGACIHVPPPPTNQIVYVSYPQGLPQDIVWDAIWVTGTLSAVTYDMETFAAGYSLKASMANPYDEG